MLGLKDELQYQKNHRVLNRAKWSSLRVSQILLGLIVTTLVGLGVPVMLGADETLERRGGRKIKAQGIFRNAVCSSRQHTVYCADLRWTSMMVLVPVPWSRRAWALPFLTVLAPSKTTNAQNGQRHKTSIDWIGQMIAAVRRWLPERALLLVTDGGLAAVQLGLHCAGYAHPVTYV